MSHCWTDTGEDEELMEELKALEALGENERKEDAGVAAPTLAAHTAVLKGTGLTESLFTQCSNILLTFIMFTFDA
jgi:hypothetical protein